MIADANIGFDLQDALLFREIEARHLMVNCTFDGLVTVTNSDGRVWRGASLREVMKEVVG